MCTSILISFPATWYVQYQRGDCRAKTLEETEVPLHERAIKETSFKTSSHVQACRSFPFRKSKAEIGMDPE